MLGGKIDLEKMLNQKDFHDERYSLCFSGKQKNGINYLHIYLIKNDAKVAEGYFDIHEVTMIDIAIGKAISLLQPRSNDITRSYCGIW